MNKSILLAVTTLALFNPLPGLQAQNLPYSTSWMGNTWGNGATSNYGKWMQDNINGMWVDTDGSCYTNSFWDEAGHNGTVYKNGQPIARLNFNHDYFEGGVGITGDANYVYAGNWLNIYIFNKSGAVVNQIASTSTSTTNKAFSVKGIAADSTNNLLYVTEDLDGLVQVWNKSSVASGSGTMIRSWSVSGPGACATSGDGTVWVAQPSTGKILHYNSSGTLLSQQITGGAGFDPEALCFDNSGRLMVGDNGPDQNVKFYSNLTQNSPTLAATFGTQGGIFSGTAGAVGPLKFSGLTGVGTDSSGNYYIGQNNVGKWAYWNGGGSVLESYTSGGARNWILQGLEFVDGAAADASSDAGNFVDVYSKYNHYSLNLGNTIPGAEPTLKGHTLNQFKYPQDVRFTQANNTSDYNGGTFVRTIAGKKFLFVLDMSARRLLWYRFNSSTDGEVAIPSGLMESNAFYTITYPNSPSSGEFIWRDSNGNGQMDAGEYQSGPGTPNAAAGWWVDTNGDIWQCNNYASVSIRHWAVQGLDSAGNPIYSYTAGYTTSARPAATAGDLKRLIYDPKTDTMVIASYDVSTTAASAGDRLGCFASWSTGNRTAKWDIATTTSSNPAEAIAAAGNYVFVGFGNLGNNITSGQMNVYNINTGLSVGIMHAGPEVISITGALDIPYGISAYQRPNGGYLVFEEDDFHAKVVMYRWQDPNEVTDTLADWSLLGNGSHTSNLVLDGSQASSFDGDSTRVTRQVDSTESVVYGYNCISNFTASFYSQLNHADPLSLGAVNFFSSPNGTTWTSVPVTDPSGGSNNGTWILYNYQPSGTIPAGTNYVKVQFSHAAGINVNWDPILAQMTLTTPGAGNYLNDTNSAISYVGSSWGYSSGRNVGDYNNDVHYAMSNGDYMTYTFTGTGIKVLAELEFDEGLASVYIDGVLQSTVNPITASRISQQVIYSNQNLTAGSHTLKVVKLSGTYLIIDGLITTATAQPVIYNDTDPSFTVSGDTWNYSNNRNVGDYNNDLHYMTVNNSYWNFQFTGTGADYITETGTGSGNVQMYVDGVYKSTVQCYATSLGVQQTVYSIRGLSAGVHNIGGVKQDGSYMQVDAIKIYP